MQIRAFYLAVKRTQGDNSCTDPPQLNRAVADVDVVGIAAGKEAASIHAQAVNISAYLLSIRMDPTAAKVALLSRGVLLLLLLVPTGVAFGIASCVFGRGSSARSRPASPQPGTLKGLV
jgi:hypothetical protein